MRRYCERMRQALALAVALSVSACCTVPSGGRGRGEGGEKSSTGKRPAATASHLAVEVAIGTILKDYKANEIRADGLYKGKDVRVTGKLISAKKGIAGGMYVTLGSGAAFEIPALQCSLRSNQEERAASLNKGESVTVEGTVSGLMGNVQVGDCIIN